MRVDAIGYGAGDRDFAEHPNVLRVLVGDDGAAAERPSAIVVIECEIDDMNPQLFGPLMDRLYDGRRARRVLRAGADEEEPAGHAGHGASRRRSGARRSPSVLFRETTTIGVRYQEMQRERLDARDRTVETPVGADPVQGGDAATAAC